MISFGIRLVINLTVATVLLLRLASIRILRNYRADVYIVDNANQRHYTETIVDKKHNKPVGAIFSS